MEEEQYQIIPRHELEKLKAEIKSLRASAASTESSTESSSATPVENLQISIESLNRTLKSMQNIFEAAYHDMQMDAHDEPIIRKISKLDKKIDEVMDQNEKIAHAVLTVVDILKRRELNIHSQINYQASQGLQPRVISTPAGSSGISEQPVIKPSSIRPVMDSSAQTGMQQPQMQQPQQPSIPQSKYTVPGPHLYSQLYSQDEAPPPPYSRSQNPDTWQPNSNLNKQPVEAPPKDKDTKKNKKKGFFF